MPPVDQVRPSLASWRLPFRSRSGFKGSGQVAWVSSCAFAPTSIAREWHHTRLPLLASSSARVFASSVEPRLHPRLLHGASAARTCSMATSVSRSTIHHPIRYVPAPFGRLTSVSSCFHESSSTVSHGGHTGVDASPLRRQTAMKLSPLQVRSVSSIFIHEDRLDGMGSIGGTERIRSIKVLKYGEFTTTDSKQETEGLNL
eukprot:scaffold449_cov303-Pavlova_lutheri.AAC.2